MRQTAKISAVLLALSLAACGGKGLSKDQCNKVVDKMIQLQVGSAATPEMIETAKKMAGDALKEPMDKCMKEGTQAEFDCAMKATSEAEMEKCDD
jgi:small lipoprotein (TIGR04454 family)